MSKNVKEQKAYQLWRAVWCGTFNPTPKQDQEFQEIWYKDSTLRKPKTDK